MQKKREETYKPRNQDKGKMGNSTNKKTSGERRKKSRVVKKENKTTEALEQVRLEAPST